MAKLSDDAVVKGEVLVEPFRRSAGMTVETHLAMKGMSKGATGPSMEDLTETRDGMRAMSHIAHTKVFDTVLPGGCFANSHVEFLDTVHARAGLCMTQLENFVRFLGSIANA